MLTGTVNMTEAQHYPITPGFVYKREPVCGCIGEFPHMFCRPAAPPVGGYVRVHMFCRRPAPPLTVCYQPGKLGLAAGWYYCCFFRTINNDKGVD